MNLLRTQIWPLLAVVLTIVTQHTWAHYNGLVEVFKWKQMDFYNRGGSVVGSASIVFPEEYSGNIVKNSNTSSYIASNNVPMGATHFNGRLFVTMPRRRVGIPSTLNYIDLLNDGNNPSPKLYAYPNFEINYLNPNFEANPNRLISVYRTTVDACQRLWFIDTGMLEYPGNRTQVQRPSIWVIDLFTDSVIRRFEINEDIAATGQGLASITIDASSNRCDEAFAYIPDLLNARLYVYSFQRNTIWSFSHNYFHFDPLGGDLFVGGQSFRWDDGIFSITLTSPVGPKGYRIALFHAMASTNEFMVSTEVLQNETFSHRSDHGNDFRLLGNRGAMRQSTMHVYDPHTNVLFYAEVQRNGVGCWNANKAFSPENHGTIAQNADRMIYPSDLTIDHEGTMWIMTNSLPIFIYSNLDPNVYNFRIWKIKTVDAIKSTYCKNAHRIF